MAEIPRSEFVISSRRLSPEEQERYLVTLRRYISGRLADIVMSDVIHEHYAEGGAAQASSDNLYAAVMREARGLGVDAPQGAGRLKVAYLQLNHSNEQADTRLTTVVFADNSQSEDNIGATLDALDVNHFHKFAIERANANLAAFGMPDAYRFTYPEE